MAMDLLIATGIFALVLGVGLVIATRGRDDKSRVSALLQDATRVPINHLADSLVRTGGRQSRRRASNRREEILELIYRIHLMTRLQEAMWQAGLYMRVSEMLLIIVLMFGFGFTLGKFILQDTILALALGSMMGALPLLYIRIRRKRRMREFTLQLPAALDLIKSSLEAGHSLLRGLQVLVEEFADPMGGEFRTVLEQSRLGMPLTRALEDLLKRMPEQIRTMTAQSRMSGLVVGFLPAIVLGIFSLVQPGYAKVLFYDPTGVFALKLAIGLDLTAVFTIRRILKVDF